MTEDKKKKKKGVCSSVTYTTGDPDINIKRFNQAFENSVKGGIPGLDDLDKFIDEPSNIDAMSSDASANSSVASAANDASGTSSEGASLGESALNEDKMFATRLGVEVDLPKQIHLIPEEKVNEAIAKLEPEEEFTIGYVTPVYFYKDMWNMFRLFKCTEFEGWTGVDYIEARGDADAADSKEDRIALSKEQQRQAELARQERDKYNQEHNITTNPETEAPTDAGVHNDRNPLANEISDFSARYSQVNKTVWQKDSEGFHKGDTILFYPVVGSRPDVTYYVDTLDGTGASPCKREDLEAEIFGLIKEYTAKKKAGCMDKVRKMLAIDAATIEAKTFDEEDKWETRSRFSNYSHSVKPQVRALYTNQIYYIKTAHETLGIPSMDFDIPKESLNSSLTEKRETKRYYIRPQGIFCANKADVLKALIEVSQAGENCSVYTLKNLSDHDDVHQLSNNDIIYYYDNDVLYDKNHVMVMDYDLFIKHEEERKKINKDPDQLTKQELDQNYNDRMTKNTFTESLTEAAYATNGAVPEEAFRLSVEKGDLVYVGYTTNDGDTYPSVNGEQYASTEYYIIKDNDKYRLETYITGNDGEEMDGDDTEFESLDQAIEAIKQINWDDLRIAFNEEEVQTVENLTEEVVNEGRRKADVVMAKDLHIEIVRGDGTIRFVLGDDRKKLTLLSKDDLVNIRNRAMASIKEIKSELKSGELELKDLESEVKAYVDRTYKTFTKNSSDELFNGQKIAYFEALIRAYFAGKLAAINSENNKRNKVLDLHDKKNRNILDLAPTQIDEAKAWLQDHVTNITFKFPKVDDDVALFTGDERADQKDATFRARWNRAIEIFKDTYPDAVEGTDYTYRIAGNESDTTYEYWRATATVTFDVPVETAPQSIKTMIDRAKDLVTDTTHVGIKYADQILDKNAVNSIYFAEAVLKLFNNDLSFYKKNQGGAAPAEEPAVEEPAVEETPIENEDPFNQTFEAYDVFGNKLTEAKEEESKICCICGEEYDGHGNNAEPYKKGYCCDACNLKFVIPARTRAAKETEEAEEKE